MCYFRQLCCFITSSNSFYHIRNIKSIKKFFTTKNCSFSFVVTDRSGVLVFCPNQTEQVNWRSVCWTTPNSVVFWPNWMSAFVLFFMKIFALLTLFIKFDRHGKMFIASKSRVSKTCHIHIHLLYCLGNNFYLTKPFFHTEKCFA